ncbi:MAG: hypothetical protein ACK4TK_12060 [Thiobacillaceae bacterium]
MTLSPQVRAALWQAMRPLALGWGAILLVLALLLALLAWQVERQTQRLSQSRDQRAMLEQRHSQLRQDYDLAFAHRQDYVLWRQEGLFGDQPVAQWRALQMQKILDWGATQSPWVQQAVQMELQSIRPWQAASEAAAAQPPAAQAPAPKAESAPSAGPMAQTLQVKGSGLHDLEAFGVAQGIQRVLGNIAALRQCAFKLGGGASAAAAESTATALPNLEWECEWTLFYIPLSAPDALAAPAPRP